MATEQEAVRSLQDLVVAVPCPPYIDDAEIRVPQVAVDDFSDFEGQLEELEGLLFVGTRRLVAREWPVDWRWNEAGFIGC